MSVAALEGGTGMAMLSEVLGSPTFAGIASGLLVGFLTAYVQGRAFKRDWRRAREDMIASQAINLIREMATDLVRVAHAMWWLTWRAKNARDTVGDKQVDDFELEIRNLIPKIHGDHAALRASHPDAAKSLVVVLRRLDKLDLDFATSCIAFRTSNWDSLDEAFRESETFKNDLPELLMGCAKEVARSLDGPDGRKGHGAANG